MKTIIKDSCPQNFANYVAKFPNATWDSMRNDALNGGDAAYKEVKAQLINDQKKLCAYCECELHEHTIRVEHFHPKSSTTSNHNWHLDWNNLLVTCFGGEREGCTFSLPENLSCDASKKNEIHDGDILNPLHIPPFPAAFCYDIGTGTLLPNKKFCEAYPNLPNNTLPSTYELLINTLKILNLNCYRLCQARLTVSKNLERQKMMFRQQHIKASIALRTLTQRYMSKMWPQYFTVVRHCLQPYVDEYLRSVNYQG